MKLSFYLDTRHRAELYPLKFSVRSKSSAVYLPTNIKLKPDQWDARARRVVKHPSRAAFNNYLMRRYLDIEEALLGMQHMTLAEIRRELLARFYEPEKPKANLFRPFFEKAIEAHSSPGTRGIMQNTLAVLDAWNPSLASVTFEDITRAWLDDFVGWCISVRGNKSNTRASHLRIIRQVINAAIDAGLTSNYPFRRYRIKTAQTAKRSLELSELRRLWAFKSDDRLLEWALDMWRLIFMLMGINVKDLANLKVTDYSGGRLSYRRAKTGHLYDIKVEPEAAVLIERYRSPGGELLLDLLDRYCSVHVANVCINNNLHRIPGFGQLTTYWARHSWATLAAELDVPKETIAAGLGHSNGSVTDVYIRFDRAKVDRANRHVIDAVLGD